ncbi:DUF2452 domain-containing protein [bacterium]|nr:DUF2452 domain-containing protein [bacterium]
MTTNKSNSESIENPIDKDKVTDNPHSLEYPHQVGGMPVRPEDIGKTKGRALSAMHEQTDMQMEQLYEQMELLARQAKAIKKRVELSHRIYRARMGFDPIISHIYYLYSHRDDDVLSMLSPADWGSRMPYDAFVAKVKLLGDHTWDILEGEG